MPLPAVIVRVLVPELVRLVGLKPAVTPVGLPVVPNVTVEANPPVIVRVMVTVLPAPPCVTVRLVGDADNVKLLTVSVTVADRVRLPLVPVIVSVLLPPGVAAVVVIVKVLLPVPVTEVGAKSAEAPAGNPVIVSAVDSESTAVAASVVVNVPFWPAVTVSVPADVATEKPSVTTSVAGVLCAGHPLQLPVMVNGYVPVATDPVVDKVSVVVPAVLLVVGENAGVTPAGNPAVPNVTVEENPPDTAMFTVYVVDAPAATV